MRGKHRVAGQDHPAAAGLAGTYSEGEAIEVTYRGRIDRFSAAERQWAFRERIVVHARLVTFVLAAVMFTVGWRSGHAPPWYLAGSLALCGFVVAVNYHDLVRTRMLRSRLMRQINEQAIARLRRDWQGLPETYVDVPPEHQVLGTDLDLFGHASLFHLLCTATTPLGIRTLRDWLLEPAQPGEVVRRQKAATELAPHLELRQTLVLEGRMLADRGTGTDRFVEWAAGDPWLAARPGLRWLGRGATATALLIFLLMSYGALPVELEVLALFAVLCLNLTLSAVFGSKVQSIFTVGNLRRGEVARYLRLFELMYSMPGASAELESLRREATSQGGGVLLRLRQLSRIENLAKMRHVSLLFFFVYLPLQILFLFDFHLLDLLEKWQARYGGYARGWFLALSRLEALGALAALVHDHPQWTMPEIDVQANRLRAQQIGHPLLPVETSVPNDVALGPPGSFLLVTGSNMSGKSTLLRAVGVNVALAQAGGPVCAQRLTMPPVTLATSMRIHDSLEHGVSFYMAELMRLKQIVDLAVRADSRGHRMLLYLLDEILLGTNSRERHLAVVRVMQHLVQSGAIGAISTHDLDLATSDALAGACRCVHFRDTLHDQDAQRPMTFDYRLRPGIATTSNALALLKIVGLE
jgi:hypothetical protein